MGIFYGIVTVVVIFAFLSIGGHYLGNYLLDYSRDYDYEFYIGGELISCNDTVNSGRNYPDYIKCSDGFTYANPSGVRKVKR